MVFLFYSSVALAQQTQDKISELNAVTSVFKGISEKIKIPGLFVGVVAINNPQSLMSKFDKMMGDPMPYTTWFELTYKLNAGTGVIIFTCKGSKVEDPANKKPKKYTIQACGQNESVLYSGEWK